MTVSATDSTRTVLITGASSGIGLATALATAQAGFATVATVRDVETAGPLREAAEKAGVTLDIRRLDVTDPASVTACVAGVVDTYGRLDALVNNAGVAHLGTLELDTLAAVRATMEVNFFGVLAMSRAAMPHLRAGRGRLVTISTVRGVVGQPFNEGYSAAKFAVEGFMESLAPVAAEVGVTVSVIEPGAVDHTSFAANAKLDVPAMLASAGPYEPALRSYFGWVAGQDDVPVQSPEDVAGTVLQTLTDSRPAFRIQTCAWAEEYVAVKLADRDGAAVQSMTRPWVAVAPTPTGP